METHAYLRRCIIRITYKVFTFYLKVSLKCHSPKFHHKSLGRSLLNQQIFTGHTILCESTHLGTFTSFSFYLWDPTNLTKTSWPELAAIVSAIHAPGSWMLWHNFLCVKRKSLPSHHYWLSRTQAPLQFHCQFTSQHFVQAEITRG